MKTQSSANVDAISMTKREHIATTALNGMLSGTASNDMPHPSSRDFNQRVQIFASTAVAMADALLAELNRGVRA